MINKVTLIGNLGKEPDLKQISNDTSLLKLTVATNENYKDKNGEWQTQTEWHNVEVWKYADKLAERLHKGCLVYVEGKITTQTWEDKEGNKRSTTVIRASIVRPMEKKTDEPSKKTSDHLQGATDALPF